MSASELFVIFYKLASTYISLRVNFLLSSFNLFFYNSWSFFNTLFSFSNLSISLLCANLCDLSLVADPEYLESGLPRPELFALGYPESVMNEGTVRWVKYRSPGLSNAFSSAITFYLSI